MINSKAHQALALSVLALYVVWLAVFALTHPIYTWDTVPYLATALSYGTQSPVELHQATYQLLSASLDENQFTALTSGAYASEMFNSAEHFNSQLSMYFIKPFYVFALQALVVLGFDPLTSLILMSTVPGIAICLTLYAWLQRHTQPLLAVLIVILFSVGARVIDLARVPVPDNLSAAIVLFGLYSLIVRRWTAGAVLLLCASVLVRPNNIIYAALLLALLAWSCFVPGNEHRTRERALYTGGLLLALLTYFTLNGFYDYQWWRLFYHTFVESQIDIDSFATPFSLAIYLEVLGEAVTRFFSSGGLFVAALPLFLLILAVSLARHRLGMMSGMMHPGRSPSLGLAVLLTLPVFAAFMVLFPSVMDWDRFFVPFYALITVFAIAGNGSGLVPRIAEAPTGGDTTPFG